ncbi:MAG TPA: SDR family NAD(P)-dependent oxidoreductase [Micromonosporaceae bacterium]|nr:SDR family NAD(P)-dependent oxidoreductase [Micromonosporaceae bacterium]
MRRLANRTALITGAGGGIGREICLRLAQEGAQLFITDLKAEATEQTLSLLRDHGHEAGNFVGDVADPTEVRQLVGSAQAQLGKIDILVNCAGVVHDEAVHGTTIEDWRRVLDINLTSVFLMCRAVVPAMTEAGYGRIINIASQLALTGASGHTAYAAAKAGVIAFTKSLAREVSPSGVTANCVAPGPIDTPMLKRDGTGWTEERIRRLPTRRIGQAREVAGSVALLASEADGALYTGQTLSPNSGDVM